MTTWTQEAFDSMSWHDNHVHGLRVVEGEHGAGEMPVGGPTPMKPRSPVPACQETLVVISFVQSVIGAVSKCK
jgi:hypothetical protein